MSPGRALVEALARVAPRYTREDREQKQSLLERLRACPITSPGLLLRLHEALCFLQAYPDSPDVLARVDEALRSFHARVKPLGRTALARLHDSGIVGTTLDYPFGLPMARWLVTRFPADVAVAWRRFTGADRLEEILGLLVIHAEDDAFTEGGLGWRRWLAVARSGRPLTDLQLLIELFERARLDAGARDALFESLELPIEWQLRTPEASRTLAKRAGGRPFFHAAGIKRAGPAFIRGARRARSALMRAPVPVAESMIEAARAAMATRSRELYAFSHPNPEDVLMAEPGRGLRIALIGLLPRFRLPLEAYYAFLVLKNGVPVSYGGGWSLFGAMELGFNVFPSFRRGESAVIFGEVLRAYCQALHLHTIVIDRHQIGGDNTEALRSGAFFFYRRLGFRPADPSVRQLLAEEEQRMSREPAYRCPLPVLRRLTRGEMTLSLLDGAPEAKRRLRASRVAALVTRRIARDFAGDRDAAEADARATVTRALGVSGRHRWPDEEREAFERLCSVAVLIPGLRGWPLSARHALARIFRAKGGRSEVSYARLLDRHRRFRESLAAAVDLDGRGVGGERHGDRSATRAPRGIGR